MIFTRLIKIVLIQLFSLGLIGQSTHLEMMEYFDQILIIEELNSREEFNHSIARKTLNRKYGIEYLLGY
jgi:hypothetical protein